jgi:indolepyruvate decarboxylase
MSDEAAGPTRRDLLQTVAALGALNTVGTAIPAVACSTVTTAPIAAGSAPTSVARYIHRRLKQHGCNVLFGIPGKTCEHLYRDAASEQMTLAVTANDLEAGYAADAYARLKGLGAVAVTYGPGTLSMINAIAGAYTERSPVIVINGGPSDGDLDLQRTADVRFTHSIGRPTSQTASDPANVALTDLAVFRAVTGHAERVTSATQLAGAVDRAVEKAVTLHRPVYLEIARPVWSGMVSPPGAPLTFPSQPVGSEGAQAAAILRRLQGASKPVVLIGIEIARCGFANRVAALLDRLQVPWATTLLSKTALDERTRGFVGVYEGVNASPTVKRVIDEADQILMLGTVLGVWHRHLVDPPRDRIVRIGNGQIRIGTAAPAAADLGALLAELQRGPWQPTAAQQQAIRAWRDRMQLSSLTFDHRRRLARRPGTTSGSDPGLTYDEVMGAVSDGLDLSHVVVTDTSLSMYQAGELDVKGQDSFLCNSVWQSIGYAMGASVGAGLALKETGNRRPLVICGDGGFQTTVQGLSTLVRQRIRAIVIVLDNGSYGIEQHLIDGSYYSGSGPPLAFVTLNRWRYADLARAMGVASAFDVDTVSELRDALREANAASGPALVSVKVRQRDRPSELG